MVLDFEACLVVGHHQTGEGEILRRGMGREGFGACKIRFQRRIIGGVDSADEGRQLGQRSGLYRCGS